MVEEATVLWFGAFELDERQGELRRHGKLIRLAPQPLQVLSLLARRAGEVVTREEIRREVWGDQMHADLDRNLNVCIAQVRAALNDDSLQTVHGRGYRFIAEVMSPHGAARKRAGVRWPVGWIAAGLVMVAGLLWVTRGTGPAPPELRPMVVVLPFESVPSPASDESQTLFADGLGEVLTAQLGGAQPQRLAVIARRSARASGKRDARYVVRGLVGSPRQGLRVWAELMDARRGRRLWQASFEQGELALADFEQQVARVVTAGVVKTLGGGSSSTARWDSGECGGAWESLRRGRKVEWMGRREDLGKAVELYREAVSTEPRCMEAGAALGDALLQMARQDGGPGVWEQAREAAEWVLSKEPENAEARGVRANVRFWRDWNWAGAEQDFLYALKLNPRAAETWRDFAWFQMAMGRTREALEALRWALELDPLSARARVDAGWLYAQARRYDDAAREARQALLMEPGSKQAWECLSEALAETGDARGAARAMLAYLPAGEAVGVRGVPAGRAIREWRQRQAVRLGDPWSRAKRLAGLGQRDAALAALGEAVKTRVPSVAMLGSEPAFARYQADPEFRRLLVELRLP